MPADPAMIDTKYTNLFKVTVDACLIDPCASNTILWPDGNDLVAYPSMINAAPSDIVQDGDPYSF